MLYHGKAVYECDLSAGNICRKEYLDSINRFIEHRYSQSYEVRSDFMENIVEQQEDYRERYLEMIGQPVHPYPGQIPSAEMRHMGKDDFCDVYQLQIEVMPDFKFFGIFMVPFHAQKAPLVIAQHGGGSLPEICSDFLGESNYSFFTKRALERGMAVFAPQLLLWKFDADNGEKKVDTGIAYDRGKIDSKLKQIGISITGLEVFCIRRSIDYLHCLEFIDPNRTGMMGLSYGGYFSLHTAAADKRIKSIYAAASFHDRTKISFGDWKYHNAANTFCDGEIAALCAPRRLQVDVGKSDGVFDYTHSVAEARRASRYYEAFGASECFRFHLWDGGHRFDETGAGFDFFFDGI